MLDQKELLKLDNSSLIEYCGRRAGKGTRDEREVLIIVLCDRMTHMNMKMESVLTQINNLEATLLCDTK